MAQQIESPVLPVDRSKSFPKIATFFDAIIYIIERTGDVFEELGKLLLKAKVLFAIIVITILTIIGLYSYAQYELSGHANKEKSAIAGAVETTKENTAK